MKVKTRAILRTRTARFVYCLAGWLMAIKTPQRIYEWHGEPDLDDEDAIWVNQGFTFEGFMWMPCQRAYKLIELSERIDPVHWKHWALDHISAGCPGMECPECHGHICTSAYSSLNGEV